MAQQQNQLTSQEAIARNAQLRAALLATAVPMTKYVGQFTGGTLGGTTRVKLFNVGILTRLLIRVAVNLDIGTATATASEKGPYNLINRIRLTDYDGTDRFNCSGYMLYALLANTYPGVFGTDIFAAGIGHGSALAEPTYPTAVATAELNFWLDIPICVKPKSDEYGPADLRGAINAQTGQGEIYLNIDWNGTLVSNGNVDAVYRGAATTTVVVHAGNSITLDVYQDFLFPQAIGGQVPLPILDFMTVREYISLKSTDNIAAGLEKLVNYPNMRSVRNMVAQYVNNQLIANGDLSRIRMIANGSNIIIDRLNAAQVIEQRIAQWGDIRGSLIYLPHYQKPVETALFGNVQLGLTPANATGNCHVEFGFDSLYTKGMALPGLSQASG